MPTGVGETTNLSDGIATPALWASFGYVSDGGGAPAVPVVYCGRRQHLRDRRLRRARMPAGVPGTVGALRCRSIRYVAVNR